MSVEISRLPLRERAGSWFVMSGGAAALSAVPLVAGTSEHHGQHSLWDNGWFRLGAVLAVLAALAFMWALILLVAHSHAERLVERGVVRPSEPKRPDHKALARQVGHELNKTLLRLLDTDESGVTWRYQLSRSTFDEHSGELAAEGALFGKLDAAYAEVDRLNDLVDTFGGPLPSKLNPALGDAISAVNDAIAEIRVFCGDQPVTRL